MIEKTLGKTGLAVSQLGYGSMGIRGPNTWGVRVVDDEAADKILNSVLDLGVNFIDTSPDYGQSERRIGQFIGSRRNEYFLATKCGCVYTQHDKHLEIDHEWSQEVVRRNVESSLDRLQTDYLDILQFHGGDSITLESSGLIDLLVGFRDQGVVRFIGVSSSIPNLDSLIDLDVFDTFQIPYSCLAPQHAALIEKAAASGAGIILRGGIAHGGPDAVIQRDSLNAIWNHAKLDDFLEEQMTRAELILRYTITNKFCHTTIVGTCDLDHLKENETFVARGPLPVDVVDEIGKRVASAIGHLKRV